MKITSVQKAVSAGPVDRRNKVFFREDEKHIWAQQLYQDGYLGLSPKHAAYGIGCTLSLLNSTPSAMDAYYQGIHARNRELEEHLAEQTTLNAGDYPNEMKVSIMGIKQNAIKMKLHQLQMRERLAELKEQETRTASAIEALSDEALKAKVEEIRARLSKDTE